jgi:hypothetical protein
MALMASDGTDGTCTHAVNMHTIAPMLWIFHTILRICCELAVNMHTIAPMLSSVRPHSLTNLDEWEASDCL